MRKDFIRKMLRRPTTGLALSISQIKLSKSVEKVRGYYILKDVDHIELLPMRKKNSKRALPPEICFVQNYHRKMVETAGSLIEQLLPKSIHAVTSQGFELKVALFVIAYSLNCYLNL